MGKNRAVIKGQAKTVLLSALAEITTSENVRLFKHNKVTLGEIGICNGVATIIDSKLHTIDEGLCVLSTDTLHKFLSDIERDY